MARRILIVDDDKKMTLRRAKVLKAKGYDVLTAFNGRQGLKILKKEPVDLIVLDIQMPWMRGDQLLRIIKKDPKLCMIKVLVITGMNEPDADSSDGLFGMSMDWHPINVIKKIGDKRRGWDSGFKYLRKWYHWEVYHMMDFYKRYHMHPDDMLKDRDLLNAIEELFLEPFNIDRSREKNEPWRILIVEDDPKIRQRIVSRLEKEPNYQIIQAENGTKGLEILGKDPVDLVVLDLEMPETKGDEVLRVMGSNFVLRDIPVIVYTSVRDWDKPDDISLRKKVEKSSMVSVTYEKSKADAAWRIIKLDSATNLVRSVKELLEARFESGIGYLAHPLTFFRNKADQWMPGALEYYQPINPQDQNYEDLKSYYCSYCLKEKLKDSAFSQVYEYNRYRLLPQKKFNIVSDKVYICQECVIELKGKYSDVLGKYVLEDKQRKKARDSQEAKASDRARRISKAVMNQEIFEKVRQVVAKDFYINDLDRIEPDTKLDDLSDDRITFHIRKDNLIFGLQADYEIDFSDNEIAWIDTVRDIVDYIDDKLIRRKKLEAKGIIETDDDEE